MWFFTRLIRPLTERVDGIDPNGDNGAGLELLRSIINKDPVTFEDRMLQAVAIRLLPYATRGNGQLQESAQVMLTDLFSSAVVPDFSRMSAVSALFGFRLSYNVFPMYRDGRPWEVAEVHTVFWMKGKDSPRSDRMNLRSISENDLTLRAKLRELLLSPNTSPRVKLPAGMALTYSTTSDDRLALYKAFEFDSLNIVIKEDLIESVSKNPGPETLGVFMSLAQRADSTGNQRLVGAYKKAIEQIKTVHRSGNTKVEEASESDKR